MSSENNRERKPLTEKQVEVLEALEWLKSRPGQCSRQGVCSERHGIEKSAWATPMDFGGTNGSHHSGTAKKLAQLGLVDRYNYHTDRLNHFTGRAKGACVYRITDAGLFALAEFRDSRKAGGAK
jgi:hypothetical protein